MANPTGKGGVKKGDPGRNPAGRPSGHQSFIDRAKYLIAQYTVEQIKEFTLDETKFNKLPVYDAMIMRRVVEAVSDSGRQSMDSLLDRLLGKPNQTIEQKIETTISHKPVSATTEWLEGIVGAGQTEPLKKPLPH